MDNFILNHSWCIIELPFNKNSAYVCVCLVVLWMRGKKLLCYFCTWYWSLSELILSWMFAAVYLCTYLAVNWLVLVHWLQLFVVLANSFYNKDSVLLLYFFSTIFFCCTFVDLFMWHWSGVTVLYNENEWDKIHFTKKVQQDLYCSFNHNCV